MIVSEIFKTTSNSSIKLSQGMNFT